MNINNFSLYIWRASTLLANHRKAHIKISRIQKLIWLYARVLKIRSADGVLGVTGGMLNINSLVYTFVVNKFECEWQAVRSETIMIRMNVALR